MTLKLNNLLLKGALTACLFASSSTLYAEESVFNQVVGTQQSSLNPSRPIEFETFLTRYTTHFPSSTYSSTEKLAQGTLTELCGAFNVDNRDCQLSQKEMGIEGLLSESFTIKNLVASKSTLDLSGVDQWLLEKGISNIGDDYTQVASTHSTSTPSHTMAVGERTLKLHHFDTAKGCVNPALLGRIDEFDIIDLKDNRGGDLACTISVLESLLPVGKHHVATIYTTTGERGIWAEGKAEGNPSGNKTVLVNKNTASSAEIFAHSLYENGWDVQGFPMMGKRSIQARFKSSYGDYFMTIGSFTTPSDD